MGNNQTLIRASLEITIFTLIILLGLETFLFNLADYDVYRVIDLSWQDLSLLTTGCLGQYLLLRRSLSVSQRIAEQILIDRKNIRTVLLVGLGGSLIYGLLSAHFPFWVFGGLFLTIIFGANFINYFIVNPFQTIIFLLLFGASMNSSLLFWMHEEGNKGKHTFYAQQLAEHRDTIAEAQIKALIDKGKNAQTDAVDFTQYWENIWLDHPYLSTNYYFSTTKKSPNLAALYIPRLTVRTDNIPVYQVLLPNEQQLEFTLNARFRRSIYAPNQAYKNLTDLQDFQYAVVQNNQIIRANSSAFNPFLFTMEQPKIGQVQKMDLEGFDARVYRHDEATFVMIGEPLSEVQVWIANFGFFFTIFMSITLLWEILLLLFSQKNLKTYWLSYPIQYKIQIILIAIICALFFIISITTFIFLNQNHRAVSNERQRYISETLRNEIYNFSPLSISQKRPIPNSFLEKFARSKQCDIDIFNDQGMLLNSSFAHRNNMPNLQVPSKPQIEQLAQNPSLILVKQGITQNTQEPYLRTLFGLYEDQQLSKIISVSNLSSTIGTAPYIPFVMSKLLSVYVFLLLLSWGGGLFLVSLLNQPLQLLSSSLCNFK
ncbi:MAG: hypothetical protein AAGJ18_13855, partial [Bacteroidota bacterium]